jgi:hypothetical protein
MKIEEDYMLSMESIVVPGLKDGSTVNIFSVYNKKDSYQLKVKNDGLFDIENIKSVSGIICDIDEQSIYPTRKCGCSLYEPDTIYVNPEILKRIKNSNDPDSSIIIKPCDLSNHRYGFVYKSKGDKTLKCLNVNNPKPIKYFPMEWDTKNIPDGIDSVITRIEDEVCGCIWNNGCMAIDFDNEQVKADIEKFGFEESIRIDMLGVKSWDDYNFEYFDIDDINDTLDVLKLFPNFFKSESDDYESLNSLIDKEEWEIIKLVRERNNTKRVMISHKDDPDKMDQLYKKSMKLKYEINSRITKYDDEFMKAMGLKKDE